MSVNINLIKAQTEIMELIVVLKANHKAQKALANSYQEGCASYVKHHEQALETFYRINTLECVLNDVKCADCLYECMVESRHWLNLGECESCTIGWNSIL